MKAGDHKINISEKQYQQIVKEEFVAMIKEQYGEDVLQEGFWDKLKGGGKKIMKSYINVFKAYGEVIEDVLGLNADDPKAPDVPEPKELAQDLASGDAKEAAAGVEDMEAGLEKVQAKTNDPEVEKKIQAILKQVGGVENALGGGGQAGGPTEDSESLLNLLDNVMDEWEDIADNTQDANLKKSMDYIEKIALAELRKRRGRARLKQIRENRKNG